MKNLFTALLICIFSLSILYAQNSDDKISVDEIIAKTALAMGGMDKIKKIETLRFECVYPDHGEKAISYETMLPNKSRNPGINLVFDGKQACFLNGRGESKEASLVDEAQLFDFEIEIALFFPAFYYYPTEFAGTETINGIETYHLKTTLPRGTVVDYNIDKETFLPFKANAKFILFEKEVEWGREYKNYINVNDISFPSEFTYPGRDNSIAIAKVQSIEVNSIDKNNFEIPGTITK